MMKPTLYRPTTQRHWLDRSLLLVFTFFLSLLAIVSAYASPNVRIKDLADFEGMRDNMLIGYGLIVGLEGTGDAVNSVPFTRQSLVNMLERLGVNSKDAADQLSMKNVAAVMVTAKMPALARQGSQLDVTVSSLGDAESLEGGMLLATPLLAADGNTYAVAQGAVVVGGFTVAGNAESVTQNHTTVARISDGAIVERETGFELADLGDRLRLIIKNPDFTTAKRMREAINAALGKPLAAAVDNGTIDVAVPTGMAIVNAIEAIENVRVQPAQIARVVVDEKTGTIVMGNEVRISDVAISHANLTIRVTEEEQLLQPPPFAQVGETARTDRTEVQVEFGPEGSGQFQLLDPEGTSLADLVNGLNALGVQPRDIISILQNIKAAGAMQADLVVL